MTALSTATKTNPTLDAAIDYANRGLPIFPCNPADKKPLTQKGFKDASTNVNRICDWWTRHPTAMIGQPTGAASGFWVLDIDVKPNANGEIALAKLEADNGDLPATPIVSTPSGGRHYYFKHSEGVKNRGGLKPGIDVRGDGGYVIAAGSVKDDGTFYVWQNEAEELATAPAWLLALVIKAKSEAPQTKTSSSGSGINRAYVEAAITSELQKLVGTVSNRNNQLNDSSFAIGQFVGIDAISYREAEERIFGAAKANGYVGKDGPASALATIKSGLDAGQQTPRKIPEPKTAKVYLPDPSDFVAANDNDEEYKCLNGPSNSALSTITQDAMAMRFAEINGDKLRYCHSTGAWFEWNGVVWHRNETKLAFHWARVLSRELSASSSDKEMKEVQKASFARAVETYCQADTVFAVTIGNWDNDPFKLGTPGGTVDLQTGVLSPAKQSDGITKLASVAPAETPHCPQWLKFLAESTGDDTELIRYLQQWCGYALTGDTREHALVFVYGGGGNGKSVFLNTASGILNQYSVVASMDTFTASRDSKHPTDLAMLRGARLVTASETEEGKPWAEARIKQMTGGDAISARFMRQDFFTFKPQFKLTIVGNHKPVLQNIDEAARRRFNIIPFTRKPEKPDKQLESKLRDEWPGILRWMIDGCLDWLANGLVRPESIVAATNEYFEEQDLFGQWLEECCDVEHGNRYKTANATELFNSWSIYASAAGEDPGKAKSLSSALVARGFSKKRATGGKTSYTGLMLNPKDNSQPDD